MGRKLYKTSMLNVFRVVVLLVMVFFFNDFYLGTFTHEKFQLEARFNILDVLNFHYHYPTEFVTLFCFIIIPSAYYAFIRGVRFHEKGFVFNRGLPFLSHTVFYKDVKGYKLLHPKYAISVTTRRGEAYVVADNSIERVIAILDQQNVPGDLASSEYVKLIANYQKFIFIVTGFTAFLFALKKFGVFFSK